MASINNILDEIDQHNVATFQVCAPHAYTPLQNVSQSSIKIIHINIRSVHKNLNSFLIFLAHMPIQFDLLILTECRLKNAGPTPTIDGYTAYSTIKNPIQNDGVVIYVKNNLKCTVTEPSFFVDANCLICRTQDTAIIGIYRSPSYTNLTNFYNSLETAVSALNSSTTVAVMGDLNVDIKPNNGDPDSHNYLLHTATLGLLPAFLHPTRPSSNTCLDHILLKTKSPSNSFVLETSITDHYATALCIDRIKVNRFPLTTTRINYKNAVKDVESADLAPVMDATDANIAADNLITTLKGIVLTHTSHIKVSRKSKIIKPWMTPGLIRCIKNRDSMHLKQNSDPQNMVLKITYTRYRNFCNRLINKLKRSYEKSQFTKAQNNSKATWKVVKKLTYTAMNNQPATNLLTLSTDPLSSVNLINNYFANVGKKLASKITTLPTDRDLTSKHSTLNSIALAPVSESDVEIIIISLRDDCATGWDHIPAKLIKMARNVLVPPITHICNLAISQGVFPRAFKTALVTPIYKTGDKEQISNYRPISVLSALSKIMERVLNNCLTNYLTKFNILANNQYGFRHGTSTEDAVIDLVQSVADKLDNKMKCYGIFLDLSKAFDTVCISKLIEKMENVGIRGLALDIFKDYLSDRRQSVKIGNIISTEEQITFGVPQGSILGPTLFLIYVNDLCNLPLINCEIFTYADDTALVAYGKCWDSAKLHSENALRRVMHWLVNNLLTLNVKKTKFLRFILPHTSKPADETGNIKAHNCLQNTETCTCMSLAMVESIKYLGVFVDEKLDWTTQLESLTSRTRRLIYIFKNLRFSADKETLRMVYLALCQAILTYCIPVWGGTHKTELIKLERAQRAVLKVIHFKPRDYSTFKLYSECNVLTVRKLYILRSVLYKHSMIPFNKQLVSQRRRGFPLCPTVSFRTAFARRQFNGLSARLYNKAHKKVNIYALTKREVKHKVNSWLLTLTYSDTEELLTTVH